MLRVLPTEGLSILTKLKISIGPTPPPTRVFMKHHFELILTNSTTFCYTLLAGSVTDGRRINFQFRVNSPRKKTIRLLKIDQRYEHKWISEARIRAEPGPIDSISRRDPPNNAKTKRSDLNTTKIQINTPESTRYIRAPCQIRHIRVTLRNATPPQLKNPQEKAYETCFVHILIAPQCNVDVTYRRRHIQVTTLS
jgi:hypothetical protein